MSHVTLEPQDVLAAACHGINCHLPRSVSKLRGNPLKTSTKINVDIINDIITNTNMWLLQYDHDSESLCQSRCVQNVRAVRSSLCNQSARSVCCGASSERGIRPQRETPAARVATAASDLAIASDCQQPKYKKPWIPKQR